MLKTNTFFDSFCKNARHNAILIMDTTGKILEVNQAFITSFGYKVEDVYQKNFSMLFTDEDKKINRPEREIQKANNEGSGNDDNYLVQKSGKPVWVNGESVLVTDEDGEAFIIKIIHNIEAQKQLERFLLQSNDFIEDILDSITDRGLLIADASMKVVKVNHAFLEIFNLITPPAEDSRISSIGHPFWNTPEIKQLLRDILVKDTPVINLLMVYTDNNEEKKIEITSKLLHSHNSEKKLLLVVKPV